MSNKLQPIALEALTTVTGGFLGLFGSADRRVEEWNKTYRSGDAKQSADFFKRDIQGPRW